MSLSATFLWHPYVSTYARRGDGAAGPPGKGSDAARVRICTSSDKAGQSNRKPPARQPAGSATDAQHRLTLDGGHVVGGEVGGDAVAGHGACVLVGLAAVHHVGDDGRRLLGGLGGGQVARIG